MICPFYLESSKVYCKYATPYRAAWLIHNFVNYVKSPKAGSEIYKDYVDADAIAELLNEECYQFGNRQPRESGELMFFTFETANAELVGGVILSIETPWYAKTGTLLSLSEVATFAVPGYSGITRMVIELMELLASKNQTIPIVLCAGASVPATSSMVSNTYLKNNFDSHPVFFKLTNRSTNGV